MEHQNWEPVVLRRGAPRNNTEAVARGLVQQKVRDSKAPEHQHNRALAESEEVKIPKKVLPESRAELVKARLAKGFTQDQADAACALPKHTIKGLEAGQITPNNTLLSKIKRELGVDLRLG